MKRATAIAVIALTSGTVPDVARAATVVQGAARHLVTDQPSGGAWSGAEALDSLTMMAARLTARYADRRVAVADGYRRLGVDFPGMGEHWLNPSALLRDTIDPARPALLMFATIGGKPQLLGVGFVTRTRGDSAANVPGWPDAWHEHSGLVSDESGAAPSRSGEDGTHIWVMHAWTGLENPAGRYAPDNWNLPFARLNMAPPPGTDADVGRALALISGGDAYLSAVLTDANLVTRSNAGSVNSAIAAARERVLAIADRASASGGFTPQDADLLRDVWDKLGKSLRKTIGARVEPLVAPSHAHRRPDS
jgi:hypothetical protein